MKKFHITFKHLIAIRPPMLPIKKSQVEKKMVQSAAAYFGELIGEEATGGVTKFHDRMFRQGCADLIGFNSFIMAIRVVVARFEIILF